MHLLEICFTEQYTKSNNFLKTNIKFFLASSLLNWSYQSAQPCSVLVGENTQIIPASKTSESETNDPTECKSVSTTSSGGKVSSPVYSRKRRDVSPLHAVFFPNVTSLLSNFSSEHVGSVHVSTERPEGSTLLHASESVVGVVSVSTNSPSTPRLSTALEDVSTELMTDSGTDITQTTTDLESLYGDLTDSSDASLFEGEEPQLNELGASSEVNEQSEELQRDSPIFIIEQEISSEQHKKDSSKELTNGNLVAPPLQKDFILKEPFNKQTNESQPPPIKVFELPPTNPSSKHVQVNITISTDPQNPHDLPSVYVLTVSVPTDGKEPAVNLNTKEGAFQPNEKHATEHQGGACECECPCLEESPEILDGNATDYFDYDGLFASKEYNGKPPKGGSTKTSRRWWPSSTEPAPSSTTTNCPEISTKPPPPPTILIMEGNVLLSLLKVLNGPKYFMCPV